MCIYVVKHKINEEIITLLMILFDITKTTFNFGGGGGFFLPKFDAKKFCGQILVKKIFPTEIKRSFFGYPKK